tara:strand:- start:988 stop:1650 length:663 start_codon:yes stop_codon:yes gene_type:complete
MWIKESARRGSKLKDMYSISGVDVFIKDKLPDHVDPEFVFKYISSLLPPHVIDGVDIIYIGEFPRFKESGVNAYYEDGAIYVSNEQDDDRDMIDDIVHEIAHASEELHMDEIYIKSFIREFKAKRRSLAARLEDMYEIPENIVMKIEYDKKIDDFFHKEVGYDILNQICVGIFPSAYAATSIREYFARGFEEYFIGDRENLKNTCPILYRVLHSLISTED